jgi:hypothetical protein
VEVRLGKLIVPQLVKFSTFYGVRRFISIKKSSPFVYTLSQRSRVTSSIRSTLILSSHRHLILVSDPSSSGFPNKILCAFMIAPVPATCPSHLILHFIPRNITYFAVRLVLSIWTLDLKAY